MRLRNIGDLPGAFAPRPGGKRSTVQDNIAGLDRQETEDGLEQRRLAGAVGAKQGPSPDSSDREAFSPTVRPP